jgi:hypothetical protein
VGYVYFFPDGTPPVPPSSTPPTGASFVHFNLSQLGAVMQMLREEKPILLYEFA